MKKHFTLSVLLLWGVLIQTALAQTFSGGSGIESDPYKISTVADLETLATKVNSGVTYTGIYFRMENDIDIAALNDPDPIGVKGKPFDGIFDGNNFSVLNYRYNNTEGAPRLVNVGLFGWLSAAGVIKNLKVENGISTRSYENVALLCAYNEGTIINSSATGIVSAAFTYGCLVALNKGVIKNSYAKGEANAHPMANFAAGVLVGENHGLIENSYAIGNTEASDGAGVFVGRNESNGIIRNSYAVGCAESRELKSYFAGLSKGEITNSYYYNTKPSVTTGVNKGVTIKTEEEMKTVDIISDLNIDQPDPQPWRMDLNDNINSGYPILLWQSNLPTAVTLDAVDVTPTSAILKGLALQYSESIIEQGFQYRVLGDGQWINKPVLNTGRVENSNVMELLLEDLAQGVSYEFRVYAQTVDNFIHGDSKSFVTFSSSILEKDMNEEIVVYPNLVKDIVTISASGLSGVTPIYIYDTSGKMVCQRTMSENRVEVDIAFLPQGIYLLKVGNKTTKLIKE